MSSALPPKPMDGKMPSMPGQRLQDANDPGPPSPQGMGRMDLQGLDGAMGHKGLYVLDRHVAPNDFASWDAARVRSWIVSFAHNEPELAAGFKSLANSIKCTGNALLSYSQEQLINKAERAMCGHEDIGLIIYNALHQSPASPMFARAYIPVPQPGSMDAVVGEKRKLEAADVLPAKRIRNATCRFQESEPYRAIRLDTTREHCETKYRHVSKHEHARKSGCYQGMCRVCQAAGRQSKTTRACSSCIQPLCSRDKKKNGKRSPCFDIWHSPVPFDEAVQAPEHRDYYKDTKRA